MRFFCTIEKTKDRISLNKIGKIKSVSLSKMKAFFLRVTCLDFYFKFSIANRALLTFGNAHSSLGRCTQFIGSTSEEEETKKD